MIPKVVVRKRTSYWVDSKGAIHKQISLLPQHRKSEGHNWLLEDVRQVDVAEVVNSFLNFESAPEGVYEATMTNIYRDCESGYIEDYNVKLVPYKEDIH